MVLYPAGMMLEVVVMLQGGIGTRTPYQFDVQFCYFKLNVFFGYRYSGLPRHPSKPGSRGQLRSTVESPHRRLPLRFPVCLYLSLEAHVFPN